MIAFAILSILLLLGMLFGSPQIKPIADSLFLEPCGLRGCGRLDVHRERAYARLNRRRFRTPDPLVSPRACGGTRVCGLNWGVSEPLVPVLSQPATRPASASVRGTQLLVDRTATSMSTPATAASSLRSRRVRT